MPNKTVFEAIQYKLSSALSPSVLEVLNESSSHNVPANSETHFKITLVSTDFETLNRVKRHQRVYQILSEELAGEVHALALHLYAPAEWSGDSPESPKCMGGEKGKS